MKREASEANQPDLKSKNIKNIKNKQKHPVLLYIALVAGAISIFSNSMTSHSSGISFLPSIAISLDWLHFMAVSIWVGGLFYISAVLLILVKGTISSEKRVAKIDSKDIYQARIIYLALLKKTIKPNLFPKALK